MRRASVICAVGFLVGLLAVRPVAAAPTTDLKTLTATTLKSVKDFSKQRFGSCSAEITAIEGQVRLGLISAPQGLEAGATAAGNCIADVLSKAIEARIDVSDGGGDILTAAGGNGVAGFLVGDGSLLDQFMSKLNAELEKFRKQIEKRIRAYASAVGKATNGSFRHSVVVPPLRMDVAPVPNNPTNSSSLENIIYPSRLLLVIAGSSAIFPTDGKVCLLGRAFLTFGVEGVNVGLFGPGSPAPKLNLAVGSGTGRWHTCFTQLPIGNYRILIDQDPNHDTTFAEASTEYGTIGVP